MIETLRWGAQSVHDHKQSAADPVASRLAGAVHRSRAAQPVLGDLDGRDDELSDDAAVQQAYREAAARDDLDVISVWGGEALDLITEAAPAADVVAELVAGAEHALVSAGVR